jgi:hypothetical protein
MAHMRHTWASRAPRSGGPLHGRFGGISESGTISVKLMPVTDYEGNVNFVASRFLARCLILHSRCCEGFIISLSKAELNSAGCWASSAAALHLSSFALDISRRHIRCAKKPSEISESIQICGGFESCRTLRLIVQYWYRNEAVVISC